jgi:hypothetical protein
MYRSKMMVYGIPKCTHTHSHNIFPMASIVILLLQVVRMAILKNRSTTQKTQSFPFLVEGSKNMYSIKMDSRVLSRVVRAVYMPCFLMVGLVIT